MSSLPSGTVTFLFTDIEGSTKLAQEHSDKWETLRERHHAILKSAIETHNGYVFQIIGDAFCAAFHNVYDGLSTAIQAQQKLQIENWGDTSIRVRMGLHTGSAEIRGSEYYGYMTLARVQRVMSVAYGGQILLSNASVQLIHNELPSGISLRDLKEHRLKGLLIPEHLWQVVAPDLQKDFPPLQSLNEIPNNLPVQLTSFIGRENEITEVIRLLEKARLVTLIGPGGTGKTRLSVEVARELLDQCSDGVWIVELAPIFDPLLIPPTTAITLGLHDEPQRPVMEMLCDYLREKKMLIILDNCEHLIEACAQLAYALLHTCPYIRILASSREALSIAGETLYLVPSLKLPDFEHFLSLESLSKYEAVQLFIDRAASVVPTFTLMNENASSIAKICQRLDGIPLAIELAAPKVRVLSAQQIAERLDDCFQLLTGGNRTSLPRHQTLRATIDWSYNLLSSVEQSLFRNLSVFVNGWTLEGAEEVCTGDTIKEDEILDLLAQLVNKSLVVVLDRSESGEPRYRMLETIRQYAHEKLSEEGNSEIIRHRHLTYFATLTERAEPEFYRSNQAFWFNKFEDELDNFRMAMEWALMTNSKLGLVLIVKAEGFWRQHDATREVQSWLAQLLEQYNENDSLRAQALQVYGSIVASAGDLAKAQNIANQSLELSRAISDKQAEAASLQSLGELIALHGDLERGIPIVEQSLALYRSLGNKLGQATATASLSLNNNDLEHSKAFLFESLKLYRELGHLSGIAFCLNELALRAIWEGDFSSPVQWLEEARSIYRQLGNQRGEASILENYGSLAYWSGNSQMAVEYFEEALTLKERSGNYLIDALWTRVNMAYAILRQGDMAAAHTLLKFCVKGFHDGNSVIGLVYAIEGVASLNLNQGQPENAAQLFAWADTMREKINDYRPPLEQATVEKALAVISSKLKDAQFASLLADGRTMTTDQAIALALQG